MPDKPIIFNDPVYGFVKIPFGRVFELIDHRYFQRLRRIKQLGLTYLVFPGALHTRFQHAIGAAHLMGEAIESLNSKGEGITQEESEAAIIAILLHDIGHGPFSHALESTLVRNVNHEEISTLFIKELNEIYSGELEMAMSIFKGKYSKKILNQLVCGQLDMDRLDYLSRDSFFTGVPEGTIGSERIIKLLATHNDELVVEEKGIYSIENFIISRRLMYWGVYLHKTVTSAENMLVNIFKRARELIKNGEKIFATEALLYFLQNEVKLSDFSDNKLIINYYASLDDYNILTCLQEWMNSSDVVLSRLSTGIVERQLFKITMQKDPIDQDLISDYREKVISKFNISEKEAEYLVFNDTTENSAYDPIEPKINILFKNGNVVDIAEASDQLNISVLSKPVKKYYLCYPKEIL
ncbi:MAG: HD domain-containing protein [Bacteroidetes bacterium]|nr:HD domain-containing protein [Bacteroidota bacterium]